MAERPGRLTTNAVGRADLVFFVVAAAAPLTVMAGVAPLAISLGGVGASLVALLSYNAIEIGLIGAFAVGVLVTGGADGLHADSFQPAQRVRPGAGAVFVLAFGAFVGFEATAICSEESRDPTRTVPRGTYAAVGFLYALGRERYASLTTFDLERG